MSDLFALLMGLIQGSRSVVLDGDSYTYTDANSDGNIVISETEDDT